MSWKNQDQPVCVQLPAHRTHQELCRPTRGGDLDRSYEAAQRQDIDDQTRQDAPEPAPQRATVADRIEDTGLLPSGEVRQDGRD